MKPQRCSILFLLTCLTVSCGLRKEEDNEYIQGPYHIRMVEMQGRYYITRGAVYSYHEFVRPLGDRMTDEQWQDMLLQGKVPDVPEWFAPMLLRDEAVLDERFVYCTGC